MIVYNTHILYTWYIWTLAFLFPQLQLRENISSLWLQRAKYSLVMFNSYIVVHINNPTSHPKLSLFMFNYIIWEFLLDVQFSTRLSESSISLDYILCQYIRSVAKKFGFRNATGNLLWLYSQNICMHEILPWNIFIYNILYFTRKYIAIYIKNVWRYSVWYHIFCLTQTVYVTSLYINIYISTKYNFEL